MNKFSKIYNNTKHKVIEYIVSNRLFLSYVIMSIIGTIIVRKYTSGSSNLLAFFTDLGIILIIGGLGYFIKPKNQYKYFFFWLCFFSLIEIINTVYYVFYTSFASAGELATLSQAETVTGSIWEKIHISYFLYILFPICFYYVHKKLKKSSYYNFLNLVEKGKTMCLSTIIIGVLFLALSFSNATKTDYSRLAKQWNRVYIVERFGIILYQGNDLLQTVRPKLSSLFGYEDAYQLFTSYFDKEENKQYKSDNKYTGILKDMNIVFVHMESIQDFVMEEKFNGEELTPNLNKLASEGMFFSNFYPQVSTGTSSDTEFTLLSSLMPAASGTIFVSYYDRMYNTIPKFLSNEGYYTFSMHGNYSSMWNRSNAHPSLGYQGMYFEESFDYTDEDVINLGINDKLFFKQSISIMENIEKTYGNYMGTVITLSNHSPFNSGDKYGYYDMSTTYNDINPETKKYETITTNYLNETAVGNYMQSVHYADSALGDFINYIKNSDAFENTVFVFYGDHDPKLTRKELNYLYNYNYKTGEVYTEEDSEYTEYDAFDHELNKKTPLIIWTKNNRLSKVFRGEVDYYMGMIDIQPTILNMYGLENKYALGHDIFNIRDDNTIVFPSGNYLTNRLYYNNSIGEFKIINDNTVIDDNYVQSHKENAELLLDVSNSIVVYDLLNPKENKDE